MHIIHQLFVSIVIVYKNKMKKYQLFLAFSLIAVACNKINNMGENGRVLTTESNEGTIKTYILNRSIAFDTLSYSNVI